MLWIFIFLYAGFIPTLPLDVQPISWFFKVDRVAIMLFGVIRKWSLTGQARNGFLYFDFTCLFMANFVNLMRLGISRGWKMRTLALKTVYSSSLIHCMLLYLLVRAKAFRLGLWVVLYSIFSSKKKYIIHLFFWRRPGRIRKRWLNALCVLVMSRRKARNSQITFRNSIGRKYVPFLALQSVGPYRFRLKRKGSGRRAVLKRRRRRAALAKPHKGSRAQPRRTKAKKPTVLRRRKPRRRRRGIYKPFTRIRLRLVPTNHRIGYLWESKVDSIKNTHKSASRTNLWVQGRFLLRAWLRTSRSS